MLARREQASGWAGRGPAAEVLGPREIRHFQEEGLKSLLTYAFEQVPFYREKYAAAGFHPFGLPQPGRFRLHSLRDEGGTAAVAVGKPEKPRRAGACRLLASSGSTGIPLRIYRDEPGAVALLGPGHGLVLPTGARASPRRGPVLPRPHARRHRLCPGRPAADHGGRGAARLLDGTDIRAGREDRRVAPEFISSYPSTMRNVAIALDQRGRTCDRLEAAARHLGDARPANPRGCWAGSFPVPGSWRRIPRPKRA